MISRRVPLSDARRWLPSTSGSFRVFLVSEHGKWGKIVRDSGAKVD